MSSDRFKVVPAVHLVLLRGRDVLLSRRFKTGWEDGKYSVPAGHLDGGETVLSALIREAKEEIGIAIKKEDLVFSHVMHRVTDHERVDFFFTVSSWEGEPRIAEPDRCDDLRWFSWDALPENMVAYVRAGIERSLYGDFFSEFGWEART